jgi:hypothetical protein
LLKQSRLRRTRRNRRLEDIETIVVDVDLDECSRLDFKLALAGVDETLTVTGEAPMIEATQSKVASTIQATELENLPMITRTISGMLELLPGAGPIELMTAAS